MTSGKDIAVKLLPNPLYKFNMPKAALNGNFGPFDQRRETERCRVPFFSYPGSADKNLRARNLKRNVVCFLSLFLTVSHFLDSILMAGS